MHKIIHFIKYNNALTVGMALILFLTGGAFANEGVRNAVIGEEIVTKRGIDNSQIISADLANFDLSLRIRNVTEDDASYYVSYSYQIMAIKDDIWQRVSKEKTLNVSKARLGEMDLGVYVAEELGQMAEHETGYLKEVQDIEKKKGPQAHIVSVEYTGLKGLVFDSASKAFPGYEPKTEKTASEITGVFNPAPAENIESSTANNVQPSTINSQPQIVREVIDKEVIKEIIREMLSNQSTEQPPISDIPSESTPTEPAPTEIPVPTQEPGQAELAPESAPAESTPEPASEPTQEPTPAPEIPTEP